ncbi:hypothetical protein [Marinoscillum furvescens]|uniref:Uncharacterized protein n=1 Tax=Marinoscillum furvescens DSM 4134 TaxID=1122208 RepID=A0A3D9KY20_MARFU|nr:hypothetical protein [Marinoscillum furvescens]RED92212.1 hypothetical protein C7460_13224 [Marinoscillum furvescens DSM 4134]
MKKRKSLPNINDPSPLNRASLKSDAHHIEKTIPSLVESLIGCIQIEDGYDLKKDYTEYLSKKIVSAVEESKNHYLFLISKKFLKRSIPNKTP